MLLAVTVERQAQFRIVPQGLVVVLDCALVLAFAHEHGAAVVEGLRPVAGRAAPPLLHWRARGLACRSTGMARSSCMGRAAIARWYSQLAILRLFDGQAQRISGP
jgi:hypothetical protein